MPSGGSSVRVDRVVAVVATLRDGQEQLGSGYLVTGRLVLTAEHCTGNKVTGEPAARLRVVRASDGAEAQVVGVVPDRGLDVAVLRLANDTPWNTGLQPPAFARVDQSHSGMLDNCAGIGFPLFQRDPAQRTRHTAEFHGTVYQTDERESGHLLMREPLIRLGLVTDPEDETLSGRAEQGPSPWGGLSGALMFYRGRAIGVVVEHHPRQGDNALLTIGFERIAASVQIRQCLGLPSPDGLPCVSEHVTVQSAPTGGVPEPSTLAPVRPTRKSWRRHVSASPRRKSWRPHVPASPTGPFKRLEAEPARPTGAVRVSETDPRRLGVHAAISVPGVPEEVLPEYVPRDVDAVESGIRAKVKEAAQRGGFVLLVGGSSVGKTRCAVEAVKAVLPDWWLVHPAGPGEVAALAQAPPPRTVAWLDELQRYLDGEHGLTGGVVRALLNAPHPVVIIGTLWPDHHAAYTTMPTPGGTDPHAREREVLGLAEVVRIGPAFTPAEHDRARAAAARDPRLKVALESAGYGLTQTLAAAPQLVARWEDAQTISPYAWAVLTAALDAARLGARAPLNDEFLRAAAPGYCTSHQQAEAPENWFEQALPYATGKLHGAAAALSPAGTRMGQVAGYTPADYLIQHATRERRSAHVPASTWDALISYIRDPADAARLADSARRRLLFCCAIPLYRHAANAGDRYAAMRLADLLAERGALDELRARANAGDDWAAWALACPLADRGALDELRARADAGDDWAAWALAGLLADRGDRDELRARADAGDRGAAVTLADLLAERGDRDELRARADAGDRDAARALAGLLADRGDLDTAAQILRAAADVGDRDAARALADLLAERGDRDELRARANAGDRDAARALAGLLAKRGDRDELRARADAGDRDAARALAGLLAKRGDLGKLHELAVAGDRDAARALAGLLAKRGDRDELRARANAGDRDAARALAGLLAERGDLDELRARADAGDGDAARALAGLLAERGDLDTAAQILRAAADVGAADDWYAALVPDVQLDMDGGPQIVRNADVGDEDAASRLSELLADLLTKQGRGEEAERLRRFGLNPDGSIACA